MIEPELLDFVGHTVSLEAFLKNLPSSRKVAAHDRELTVHLIQGSTTILDFTAEKICRQLVLHFLNASLVGAAKEKPNHAVGKDPVDESIDNCAQLRFTA